MIKSELINHLSERVTALPRRDIETCVNHIVEKMASALCNKERIEIRGFGSFSLHYRPPRSAHNPKTGARVHTQAKYTPHFKPGKEMRERVDQSRLTVPLKVMDEEDE